MSNLTTNNRYSFDNMSAGRLPTTNVTLPKSQPVRLKPLLHLCESDEDDDDDDESEKPRQSEDELDFDEFQLQDSVKDTENVSKTFLSKSNNSSSIESTNGIMKTTLLSKETYEAVTNTSSIQREVNFVTDREQCKVNDISDPNKLEIYNFKHEDKTQEFHNETFPSKNQADTVHNCSTNIALPPPSLSVYKGDYNAKLDTNKNMQPINSSQIGHESAYMSDILNKRKEGPMYSTSIENKKLLTRNSELNLSKDDQRYKGTYSFIEQANKDCEEESYKIPNALSESATCTSQTSENLMHPARCSLQKNITKYDVNEKYTPAKNTVCTEFSTPSLNEANKSLTNRLVSETPLKHVHHNVHPSPCISHKQLFQTPQNKLPGDNLNKNQTPSTTLSSWYHNTVRPMESKSFIARDHVQISKIRTPIIEKPDSLRFVIYSYYNIILQSYIRNKQCLIF